MQSLPELVSGTAEALAEIDRAISQYLQKWQLERLAAADRNICAWLPMSCCTGRIFRCCINKRGAGIRKLYHSEEAAKFLNGVLDKLARDHGRVDRWINNVSRY